MNGFIMMRQWRVVALSLALALAAVNVASVSHAASVITRPPIDTTISHDPDGRGYCKDEGVGDEGSGWL